MTAEPLHKSALAQQLFKAQGGQYKKDPDRPHIGYKVEDIAAEELAHKPGKHMIHAKAVCAVASHVSYKKYVKPSEEVMGTYIMDQEAIARERRLCGVRVYQTMKHPLVPRPCYHRIRAHVMLTVLAANCALYLERAFDSSDGGIILKTLAC